MYPGLGWVMWRNVEYLPEEMIFYDNYLGEELPRSGTASARYCLDVYCLGEVLARSGTALARYRIDEVLPKSGSAPARKAGGTQRSNRAPLISQTGVTGDACRHQGAVYHLELQPRGLQHCCTVLPGAADMVPVGNTEGCGCFSLLTSSGKARWNDPCTVDAERRLIGFLQA